MKMIQQKILSLVILVLFISACGSGKNETNEAMTALNGMKDIVSSAGDISERQNELKEMQPLTKDQVLQWAPESVLGLPKKESTERYLEKDKYGYSGYNTYYKGQDKSIQLEVFDGAGSTIYSRYAGMLSTDAMIQERENYYEKNVERDGVMVNEWYDSKRNDCSLFFIVDDRFVVNIKGSGFSPDEIWNNLSEFKLDELN